MQALLVLEKGGEEGRKGEEGEAGGGYVCWSDDRDRKESES